ncbi:hypothetical protein AB4Y45_02170 [Paraburkholderia sp. EG287A]|uniref:hypothetical protein n=1 Tax=unclassified Paraburkholderia TaxID=2615204 RepID=UPI0034D31423
MAEANLKRHLSPAHAQHSRCVTLRTTHDYDLAPPTEAFMPWTQVADLYLQRAGFEPRQPMRLSFDYRNNCLTISPEHF